MEKLKEKEKEEKGVILTMSLSLDKARGPLPGVIFFFFFNSVRSWEEMGPE